jgi:hypothetical protein
MRPLPLFDHLAEPTRGPHPDIAGIGLQVAILRLLGVELNPHRPIADGLDLVDPAAFRQGAASRVVVDQPGS